MAGAVLRGDGLLLFDAVGNGLPSSDRMQHAARRGARQDRRNQFRQSGTEKPLPVA